ncbi:MAG TPA: efflux RND transporter periplasmic adaptor subunit [Gemmatimonadaceae bacterium]|nr:efflux RND transporter periplasmic adaptor subunit [Gemmatimonadaceae bacterium]
MQTNSIQRTLVATGLIVSSLVTVGCGHEARGAAPDTKADVPVRVASVAEAGAASISATGTLGAKDEIPLAFKIGGVVSSVSVDEGARVRAGEPLAALDLREIDAGVAKATVGAEKTRRDAARVERLYHDSVATLVQWQDAQSARDAADADLRTARVNREFAVIAAPSDGVILRRTANAGAQVSPGTQILLFGSAARGAVLRVGLADRDAVRVRDGDAAVVTFDAYAGREFSGRVRQVGASADSRTGTYAVEVAVANGESLPSGLVGRVRIAVRPAAGGRAHEADAGVVAIPAEALVEGAGDRGVVFAFDAPEHRALRRQVTLVGVDGERVLVRGLSGVTQVITAGAAWLKDSTRVEIKP